MRKTVKIAISLPCELFEAAEHECQATGITSSEFFRQAAEKVLDHESAAVERYMQGYREQPESDEETAAARQASSTILALEPWI